MLQVHTDETKLKNDQLIFLESYFLPVDTISLNRVQSHWRKIEELAVFVIARTPPYTNCHNSFQRACSETLPNSPHVQCLLGQITYLTSHILMNPQSETLNALCHFSLIGLSAFGKLVRARVDVLRPTNDASLRAIEQISKLLLRHFVPLL
jgi:hypothetical protein